MLMTIAPKMSRVWLGRDIEQLPPRYYDTTIGQFTSRDTYEGNTAEPITLNHYLYAHANPVNLIDPSGHIAGMNPSEVEYQIDALYYADHLGDYWVAGQATHAGNKRDPRPNSFYAKPDIFNFSTQTYLEIKPFTESGFSKAQDQMGLRQEQFAGMGFSPDREWPQTDTMPLPFRFIVVDGNPGIFFNDGNGTLYYTKWADITTPVLVVLFAFADALATNPYLFQQLAYAPARGALLTSRFLAAAGTAAEEAAGELYDAIGGLFATLGVL